MREPERACQPTQVMKNAWRLWCQFAGAKAAEKEHRQGFLNSATLAVCTLAHPASLCLSYATAHFISPARLTAASTFHVSIGFTVLLALIVNIPFTPNIRS